jgi:hypothetical protein
VVTLAHAKCQGFDSGPGAEYAAGRCAGRETKALHPPPDRGDPARRRAAPPHGLAVGSKENARSRSSSSPPRSADTGWSSVSRRRWSRVAPSYRHHHILHDRRPSSPPPPPSLLVLPSPTSQPHQGHGGLPDHWEGGCDQRLSFQLRRPQAQVPLDGI